MGWVRGELITTRGGRLLCGLTCPRVRLSSHLINLAPRPTTKLFRLAGRPTLISVLAPPVASRLKGCFYPFPSLLSSDVFVPPPLSLSAAERDILIEKRRPRVNLACHDTPTSPVMQRGILHPLLGANCQH